MPRSTCNRCSSVMISAFVADVERRRRLVGDEQLRIAREGGGDGDPLAHASRELERQPV